MSGNRSYSRTTSRFTSVKDSGPYEAVVVNNLDVKYMGSLEVEILRYTGAGNTPEKSGEIFNVRYLSPFYGTTPNKGIKPNDGYANTQKSYGMWAVPPDIGTKVLVIFAEGNPNYGYWIGCIQDDYMNFMVPDGRASTERTTDVTPQNLKGVKLPVGEYNKKLETGELVDPTLFNKPYNKDFTSVLEVQGLLKDEARGTTTSSARRDIPSMVFGISTPGPLDRREGAPYHEIGPVGKKANVPYNRLGGSSFVMDDGDDKFVRKTHAEDGPPLYINKEAGETGGDETIPQNELTRIRTRTGHQILLHNSEDLIYIANSRGTAWIELTSDGKIDIHAQDSISIMSDSDINFTAERDFNIDAGRNINMKATARYSDGLQYLDNKESGRVQIESIWDTNIHAGHDYKLGVKGNADVFVDLDYNTTTKKDYHLHSEAKIYQRSDGATHESSGHSWFRTSGSNINDKAAGVHLLSNAGYQAFSDGDSRSYTTGNTDVIQLGWRHEQVTGEVHLICDSNIRTESTDEHVVISHEDIHHETDTQYHIIAKDSIYQKTDAQYHILAVDSIFQETNADHHIVAAQNTFHNALGGTVNIQGATRITGDAADIHWNSGNSAAASPAIPAVEGGDPVVALTALTASVANPPLDAEKAPVLSTVVLPYMFPGADNPVPYESILCRAPQHEPWGQHENANPQAFKKEETDREDPGMLTPADRVLTPDTFTKNKGSITSSRTVMNSGTGGAGAFDQTGDGRLVNSAEPQSGAVTYSGDIEVDPNRGSAGANPTTTFFIGDGQLATVSAGGASCQVAEKFQKNFQDFLDELAATGYEIKTLIGYSKRQTVSGSSWSVHASGGAIDINPPNPVFNTYPNGFYSPRPANAPMTDMPPNTLEIANKHGLGWGGAWRSVDDAMHFSAYKGEGGAYQFRKGFIPIGQSDDRTDEVPPVTDEQGSDLPDPAILDDTNLPGEQFADGSPNNDGVDDDDTPLTDS